MSFRLEKQKMGVENEHHLSFKNHLGIPFEMRARQA
jgi:hypothetical protein